MDVKGELAKRIALELGEPVENVVERIEVPPDQRLGDFALPCFVFAHLGKPQELAQRLAGKLQAPFLEKVEAKGPYVNVFVKRSVFVRALTESLKRTFSKTGKTIVIELAGPNTNKPLHLGHLRNIFLGQSVANLLELVGNKVVNVNIVNDRGVHICKSMLAYQLWGKNKKPSGKSDHFVGDMYVLYSKHENDDLKRKVAEMLVKWEQGNKATRALWKKMNAWALRGMNETYKKVGLKFAKEYFESDHYDQGKQMVYDGVKRGVFEKDEDGSVYANLTPYGLEKKVILRGDGTSIYITQDMYLATLRYKDYKFDRMVYVVASEQDYHFKALFAILKVLELPYARDLHHLSYGLVKLPHGKMKSREGTVVDADDLLEEMERLAAVEIKKRDKSLSSAEVKKRSRVIGHAALRFFLLKVDAVKEITFDPEESVSFEGETGPYVQYAHARIASILRKAKVKGKLHVDVYDEVEVSLLKKLAGFQSVVEGAAKQLKPHMVAHYVLELAQELNAYYVTHPVLRAEKKVKEARLFLLSCVKRVLARGLQLLQIEAPERM